MRALKEHGAQQIALIRNVLITFKKVGGKCGKSGLWELQCGENGVGNSPVGICPDRICPVGNWHEPASVYLITC